MKLEFNIRFLLVMIGSKLRNICELVVIHVLFVSCMVSHSLCNEFHMCTLKYCLLNLEFDSESKLSLSNIAVYKNKVKLNVKLTRCVLPVKYIYNYWYIGGIQIQIKLIIVAGEQNKKKHMQGNCYFHQRIVHILGKVVLYLITLPPTCKSDLNVLRYCNYYLVNVCIHH